MKTLTVAELRYMLAQLPPEMDNSLVVTDKDSIADTQYYAAAAVGTVVDCNTGEKLAQIKLH